MASRISWIGIGVGALVGGILRVAMAALHFPAIVGEHYMIALLPAILGIITGGVAAATGRVLLGAGVGAGLSFVFSLATLPLVGMSASLGAGTSPAAWEVLAVGAISGAIGGAVAQAATKRKGLAPRE
jgi:hypothetical protein